MDEKDFDLQNENLASSDEHDEKNVQPAEQIQEADAKIGRASCRERV